MVMADGAANGVAARLKLGRVVSSVGNLRFDAALKAPPLVHEMRASGTADGLGLRHDVI